MKNRWGNVIEERPKVPEVRVSFTYNDAVVYAMISRWFGMTIEDFTKQVERELNEKASNKATN